MIRRPPSSPLFPSTPLFRSSCHAAGWFPPRQRALAACVGLGPVPRGGRRDRHGGQSPGEDVPRSVGVRVIAVAAPDRKSTRLNSSHGYISYAVFCLKKKKNE